MNRAAAELSGTKATALFVSALPCAALVIFTLAVVCVPLAPFMAVVSAAYQARIKADADWNAFAITRGRDE
jgi:4-hydroxybenzoate polyprenyltransferase